jgi:hypothetical protein
MSPTLPAKEDCTIDMMLTCPEAKFLSGVVPAKAQADKLTVNTAIPLGCKKAVDAFNAAHPTMLLRDLIRKGGIRFESIKVGERGECTSFGLLGRSGGCTYRHVVCTPPPERQVTISAALYAAIAALKKKAALEKAVSA